MSKLKYLQTKPFYLVLSTQHCKTHSIFDTALIAIKHGVNLIQLREKNASTRQIIQLGKALKKILTPYHIPLIINDDIEAAKQLNAEGIHLGQKDLAVHRARALLGSEKIIGLSLESYEQTPSLTELSTIDYVGIGPIFETNTKKDASNPMGLRTLKKIADKLKNQTPIYAIGGIDEKNIISVLKAGAEGIAVVSCVCSASDVASKCSQINSQLTCFHLRSKT